MLAGLRLSPLDETLSLRFSSTKWDKVAGPVTLRSIAASLNCAGSVLLAPQTQGACGLSNFAS